MIDRNDVIMELETCLASSCRGHKPGVYCPFNDDVWNSIRDALELLKAQEKATIEPKRIELEEETKAWLNDMDAVDALGNIADICIDWDGYRTANGLGGLVNEIWAYARYCADRLLKAQEPVEPVRSKGGLYHCGSCGEICVGYEVEFTHSIIKVANYCHKCGRKVKWE